MKLSAAGRIKAVYSGGQFANVSFSINFAVACSKDGGFECMLSKEGCHHLYSDGVHIRKVKQLLYIVMYRACHQTWGWTSVEERECNV